MLPDAGRSPQPVAAATLGVTEEEARAALLPLGLLHPRDLGRPVGVLSVGQQRRLALALVVLSAPDVLLLDEPARSATADTPQRCPRRTRATQRPPAPF